MNRNIPVEVQVANVLSSLDDQHSINLPCFRNCIMRSIEAVGRERRQQDSAGIDIADELARALSYLADIEGVAEIGAQVRQRIRVESEEPSRVESRLDIDTTDNDVQESEVAS